MPLVTLRCYRQVDSAGFFVWNLSPSLLCTTSDPQEMVKLDTA
jgi:hypothetical protein